MEYALQTVGVTKTYNKRAVLKEVYLNVPQGSIYGLIGKNGAGKSTLLRILTGSLIPSNGYVVINNKTQYVDLDTERRQIGSIIDSPTMYSSLSAYQNLKCMALLLNIPNMEEKISEMLSLVGLENEGKKKVNDFSLGMKQRLALALALINDPKILILDEPVNGMDPFGIIKVRKILEEVNARGVTILISSHLLDELSKIAVVYGVLDNGILLKEVTSNEVVNKSNKHIEIDFTSMMDMSRAKIVLSECYGDDNVKTNSNNKVVVKGVDETQLLEISKKLVAENICISSIKYCSESLEDYFINLLRGNQNA